MTTAIIDPVSSDANCYYRPSVTWWQLPLQAQCQVMPTDITGPVSQDDNCHYRHSVEWWKLPLQSQCHKMTTAITNPVTRWQLSLLAQCWMMPTDFTGPVPCDDNCHYRPRVQWWQIPVQAPLPNERKCLCWLHQMSASAFVDSSVHVPMLQTTMLHHLFSSVSAPTIRYQHHFHHIFSRTDAPEKCINIMTKHDYLSSNGL
jgi:hypothetical protein